MRPVAGVADCRGRGLTEARNDRFRDQLVGDEGVTFTSDNEHWPWVLARVLAVDVTTIPRVRRGGDHGRLDPVSDVSQLLEPGPDKIDGKLAAQRPLRSG